MKKRKEYLVVFEDVWNNKESFRTFKIGDTIKELVQTYDLKREEEVDYKRYNKSKPYDKGTFGNGFYDISFEDNEGQYAGRIMIFEL